MPAWKGIVGRSFTAEQFADYFAGLSFSAWRPSFIVLHNTGAPTFAQWHCISGEQRMKNLECYYRDGQKWSASPHLFIADDSIWVFTALTMPGSIPRRGIRFRGVSSSSETTAGNSLIRASRRTPSPRWQYFTAPLASTLRRCAFIARTL